MTTFLQTLLTGLAVGSLYALIALGYTMVYGVLKFINFAHGDIVMTGAWIALLIAGALLKGPEAEAASYFVGPGVLVASMILCAILGFAVERLAYRPLRHAPKLNVLITAIGVSLLIQNVGQLQGVFGKEPGTMPESLVPVSVWANVGGVGITNHDVIIILTAIVLMAALDFLVFHTRLGLAMRAVAFDRRLASLMGVPADRVVSLTFVVGSALAAAGGFLFATKYRGINQPADMSWVLLGLKAFVAAVVGGIGNVRGAMLGGLMIGLIENFGAQYLSADLRDVYVFGILILVLLVKPSGVLGRVAVEKV